MKGCRILTIAFFLLLRYSLPAQDIGENTKISDESITQEVSRLLRWSAFWETRPLEGYVEGKNIEMTIVESPKEIAILLGEIGVSLQEDSNGRIGFLRGFPPTTNSAAVEQYVTEYDPTPSFRTFLRQGRAPALTMAERARIFRIRTIPYTLPELEPPESVQLRLKSPELPRLKEMVPTALDGWYSQECGKGEVQVPYFAADDPWVPVYADLGSCGKGIIYFTHRDEIVPWEFSFFRANEPPNDFTNLIQKIRDNAADTISLPTELH